MISEAVFRLRIFLPCISGLIMPLTKPDGTADLTSILNHITLLEQTVDILQKDTNKMQIDLRTTNARLQLTEADLNITRQELQTSRTELQATKNVLQHTQNDLQITKKNLQAAQADLLTNKGLQQSAAAEILSLSNEMTILKQMATGANSTSVSIHEVQQNLLSLKSDLNATQEDITMTNSVVHFLNKNMSDVKKLSVETKQALAQLAKTLASKTTAVAFQAYASSYHNVTTLHPVVYDSIIYDTGSGYSATTGKFTAPVSGTYMFWAQVGRHLYFNNPPVSIKQSGKTIGSASKTTAVAFQVYASSYHHVTTLHPVVYDSIIYDTGSGYSTTTGKFTAPVSGTYMFWAQVGRHLYFNNPPVSIKQSGKTIGSGWSVPTYTRDESVTSTTCVSHLQKGEEVWVQLEMIQSVIPSVVSVLLGSFEAKQRSYFGGALLTAD